jgi:EAL domain-containing protein (putative c-di-GMP-specific phosphodiesterase class I)
MLVDENGEIVAPNEFIPAAERYGSSAPIDCWVIDFFFIIIIIYRIKKYE